MPLWAVIPIHTHGPTNPIEAEPAFALRSRPCAVAGAPMWKSIGELGLAIADLGAPRDLCTDKVEATVQVPRTWVAADVYVLCVPIPTETLRVAVCLRLTGVHASSRGLICGPVTVVIDGVTADLVESPVGERCAVIAVIASAGFVDVAVLIEVWCAPADALTAAAERPDSAHIITARRPVGDRQGPAGVVVAGRDRAWVSVVRAG